MLRRIVSVVMFVLLVLVPRAYAEDRQVGESETTSFLGGKITVAIDKIYARGLSAIDATFSVCVGNRGCKSGKTFGGKKSFTVEYDATMYGITIHKLNFERKTATVQFFRKGG